MKAFGSVPAGPSRRRRLPPNLPDAVAQAHPSHTRDGDGPPLGFRGCAGWGTDGRTDGTERGETARIFHVAKRAAEPTQPNARSAGAGARSRWDRDGTGSLSRSAARLPLAWTRGRLPAFASCHVGRVPPTAHVSLPFPACGCGAGPLPDRRSLPRGSTNWLGTAGRGTVLEAFCIVFFSL